MSSFLTALAGLRPIRLPPEVPACCAETGGIEPPPDISARSRFSRALTAPIGVSKVGWSEPIPSDASNRTWCLSAFAFSCQSHGRDSCQPAIASSRLGRWPTLGDDEYPFRLYILRGGGRPGDQPQSLAVEGGIEPQSLSTSNCFRNNAHHHLRSSTKCRVYGTRRTVRTILRGCP